MCNLGQALFDEGYRKGFKKGFVKTLLRAIVSIVKHYGVTTEQAMADLGIPENECEEYKEMLEKEMPALTCQRHRV